MTTCGIESDVRTTEKQTGLLHVRNFCRTKHYEAETAIALFSNDIMSKQAYSRCPTKFFIRLGRLPCVVAPE